MAISACFNGVVNIAVAIICLRHIRVWYIFLEIVSLNGICLKIAEKEICSCLDTVHGSFQAIDRLRSSLRSLD